MSALEHAPLHAIDISVHSRYFPMPMLTLGGLKVDELTGAGAARGRQPHRRACTPPAAPR